MRSFKDIYQKRIRAEKDLRMHYGSPDSRQYITLPAGDVSPLITSYLMNGWFQLEGDESGSYYIKDQEGLRLVSEDAESESNIFTRVGYRIADYWNYQKDFNVRKSEYLSEGLKESISDIGLSGSDLAKNLRYVLIGLAFLAVLLSINQITRLFK